MLAICLERVIPWLKKNNNKYVNEMYHLWCLICFACNISGKVQRVEQLGDVMDVKVLEWKLQHDRLVWAWFSRCNISVLNVGDQVINWKICFTRPDSGFVLFLILGNFLFITGEVISERDKCPQCKGRKVTQEKKVLDVHVEKGMQHGQKIVFEGQADEAVSEVNLLFVSFLFCFVFNFSIFEPFPSVNV